MPLTRLQVKFNWSKKGQTVDPDQVTETNDNVFGRSRNSKNIHKWKQENPSKYKQHLKQDAKRKKEKYAEKMRTLSKMDMQKLRQKWAENKRKQRSRICEKEKSTPKKKFCELNELEKKEYFKMKMRERRNSMSKQKKTVMKQKDKERKKSSTPSSKTKDKERKQSSTPFLEKNLEASYVAENIKNTIKMLSRSGKDKDRTALQAVIRASVSSKTPDSRVKMSQVRRYLNVSCHTWKKIRKRSKGIITKVRKQRKGIPKEHCEAIEQFWLSPAISRPLPLKRTVRNGKPTHLLECSYSIAYKRFKDVHPGISVGFVKFLQLRPKNVRHMRPAERIVCCCLRCENIKLKLSVINRLASTASFSPLSSDEIKLSELTLCNSEGFPSNSCLSRKCKDCGVKKISEQLKSLLEKHKSTRVKFFEWQRISKTIQSKNGKVSRDIKVMDRVQLECTLAELVLSLEKCLIKFSSHIFRALWQQMQLKKMKEKIKAKSAIIVMDYAENYVCSSQDEIQSAHWVQQSVTIHPMAAVINASDTEGNITNHESIVFITSDPKHDADGVAHFTSVAYPHLKEKYGITSVEEWSDCCAVQYRCGKSLADISSHKDLTVCHHFFEASHGKSAADGIGAVTKNAASMAVTRRQYTIKDAKSFFDFCQAELVNVGKGVYPSQAKKYATSSRIFFYCEGTNRTRPDREVKTVPGTMAIHCVASTGEKYKIRSRALTCTCTYCWSGEKDKCQQEEYVGKWNDVTLQLKDPTLLRPEATNLDNHPEADLQTIADTFTCIQQSIAAYNNEQLDFACSMSRFENMLKSKGWEIHGYTPSDGNCLFWAISSQLELHNPDKVITHVQLRSDVVSHLENLPNEDKLGIANFLLNNDLQNYIFELKKDGTYGDQLAVKILCDTLQCQIRVVSDDTEVTHGSFPITLNVGYVRDQRHYVSLTSTRFEPTVDDFVAVRLFTDRRKRVMYLAKVTDVATDIQLKFLSPTKTANMYTWPHYPDSARHPREDILGKVSAPVLTPGRGIVMEFNPRELELLKSKL